jgi:hypothetical protein
VVALYQHRGAFETVLSDEDKEQDPDRWVSHSSAGQEFWQILSQWVWNVRLELGHRLHPTPMRTTEFAPAQASPLLAPVPDTMPAVTYGPPEWARAARTGTFAGTDFEPQPDGTLRCPANHSLYAGERRVEPDGTLRVVYVARLADCRQCPLREPCLFHGKETKGPRRVSAVLRPIEGPPGHTGQRDPLPLGSLPILWEDWSRCSTRRDWRRVSCAHKRSLSPSHRVLLRLKTYQIPSHLPEHNGRIGDCRGHRGSPAMPLNPPGLASRFISSGFRPLLRRL